MAQDYGIAVVVTNQVNSSYSCTNPNKSMSARGNIMAHISKHRICLSHSEEEILWPT